MAYPEYLPGGFLRVVYPAAPAPAPSSPVASTSTGVSPRETSYSLYGHTVPLSVFGKGRIGGEIIAGPWVENGLASFIISFGVPADPSGTRELREIAFDSEVIWTGSLIGAGTPSAGGFTVSPVTCRFYDGNLTQAADALETAHFGSNAVAYRPQILLAISNLPLANTKYNAIPYVASVIADTTGDDVNLGEAFERLAYSPWVGYTSDQFETSGIDYGLPDGGLIIADDSDFLSLIQQFGRFYTNWDILQTDKLRIVDRGATVTADLTLDATRLMDNVTTVRQGPDAVRKTLELFTIDPDADYTILSSVAQLPTDPAVVTTSVGKDTAYLPAIMDSSTRMSIVTLAKYHEEQTRKTISGTAMAYGLEIEPGALVRIADLATGFNNETFKVVDTLHGANNTVEFTAAAILICDTTDLLISNVVLLMGFEGADGSQTGPGFTDESPAEQGNASIANSPQIDTAQFKFGTSSLLITGAAPLVLFNGNSDFFLSDSNSDEFTIECWARFSSFISSYNTLVCKALGDIDWIFAASNTKELVFQSAATEGVINVDVRSASDTLTTDIWYHLAVDKDSTGKIRLYKDGVMVGSDTPADSTINHNTLNNLTIGSKGFGSFPLAGWIDEIRITKGVARYASDSGFAVPTEAFPRES